MKILFFALHWGYLRNYASVLAELARNGHRIHIVADTEETFGNQPLVERLAVEHATITFGWSPRRGETLLRRFKRDLRHGINFLRYQESMYLQATALKDSGAYRTPQFIRWLARHVDRQRLERFLRRLERALPLERDLLRFIREQQPELVLVSPLLGISEDQFDELRAALRLGCRTAFLVASWDNLSSMAYIRFLPGRVFVWNEVQRQEAVQMHGVPEDRVVVTGAQGFDKWFDRTPVRTREEFCSRVGLRADRPYLLYLCSCLMPGSPSEAEFAHEWVRALRASDDPLLRDAGILIRPHPQRLGIWQGVDLAGEPNVTLWGTNPIDDESQDDYFDSMAHSALVFGLSSTAMLEAGAIGKAVLTVLLDRFRANQEEMPHFPYLIEVQGGLLYASRSLEEHVAQLAEQLHRRTESDPRSERFTRAFIRPHGLDVAATSVFVQAVQQYGLEPQPARRGGSAGAVVSRWTMLYPLLLAYGALGSVATVASGWRRLIARPLRRVRRRLNQALLRREKAMMPSAYLMARTYPQLAAATAGRISALLSWASGGLRDIVFDDPGGTRFPGILARYLFLYPLITGGTIVRGLRRLSSLMARRLARIAHSYRKWRHRSSKRESRLGQAVRGIRSDLRMRSHRARKRLRSRTQGLLRRMRRLAGRSG